MNESLDLQNYLFAVMPLPVKIKLNNVKNLSTARFAAAAGIDYIGFCLDPSSTSFVPPVNVKEMAGWLSGSFMVGEFGKQEASDISDMAGILELDIIEVLNTLPPSEFTILQKPVIKKLEIDSMTPGKLKEEMLAFSSFTAAFHLCLRNHDAHLSTELLSTLCHQFKVIWGIPFSGMDLESIVHSYRPYGISLNLANDEDDFELLNEIVERVKE